MAQTLGFQLLSALVRDGGIPQTRKVNSDKLKKTEQKVFEFLQNFIIAHGGLPSVETVKNETGIGLVKVKEPFSFYEEKVHLRYLTKTISTMMIQVQSRLVEGDAMEAADLMISSVTDLAFINQQDGLLDFRYAKEGLVQAYVSKQQFHDQGVKTGWPYLDDMMGSVEGGDVLSVVGRPACLSGESKVQILRNFNKREFTLAELYRCFNGGLKNISKGKGGNLKWDLSKTTKIHSHLKEKYSVFNFVEDVVFAGVKKTYTVVTVSGKSIRATLDHGFKSSKGYKALKDLKAGDKVFVKFLSVPGRRYGFLKEEAIASITYYGEEESYDVCMRSPHNNFVANDFVVHNSGKTFLLLKMAYTAWSKQKKIPLIVTPEMKPIKLSQRLAAIYTKKSLTNQVTAQFSSKVYDKFVTELSNLEEREQPFFIVDGTAVPTIEDLYLLCRQLQPESVYYDGAYLMKHKNPRISKWERIAETANGLKHLSTDLNLPVVCSYQFNKEVSKKNKKKNGMKDIGLEDIYGSDEIGQLSSVVLGLLQDDSIKTLREREVSILKGRNGETGMFNINWDFQFMNFDQVVWDDPDMSSKDGDMVNLPPMIV